MSHVLEERTVKIPTCKIDKSTLKSICELIEHEASKDKADNQSTDVDYGFIVKGGGREIRTSSIESFLNSRWPRMLDSMYLFFRGTKQIDVVVGFSTSLTHSYFIVAGTDPTWVNGIALRLDDFFRDKQNINHVFRKPRTLIPIVIILSFAIGFPLQLLFDANYGAPDFQQYLEFIKNSYLTLELFTSLLH